MALLYGLMMLSMAASTIGISSATHDHYVSSRATFYQTHDGQGTPSGACGLGEFGRKINHARVTGVSRRLYKDGVGCGLCYQVRCKNPKYCSKKGTKVMVTDSGEGDDTDFILSHKAYAQLGCGKAAAQHLFAAGVVEVEFRRVPCRLPGPNILTRVDEKHSDLPNYVAVLVLYQGGHGSVQGVKTLTLAEEDKEYQTFDVTPMRRAYGAVWDLAHPKIVPFFFTNISGRTGFNGLTFLVLRKHCLNLGHRPQQKASSASCLRRSVFQ